MSERSHVGLFCAVFGYVSLYRHGIWDLFIAESVFIVPALLTSALAIATKGWLLLRRVERRRADAVGAVKERRNRKQMRAALHMLLQRFVLQHEEHAHEELKNANDRGRYEGYGYMLGIAMEARPPSTLQPLLPSHRLTAASIPSRSLLLQDAPFAVVNSLFLVRTATSVNNSNSTHDTTAVAVLLLVLLSSVASLMYKLMKLRTFPAIWREHSRLIREKVKLVARAERLKMEVQATVMPESEGSDFDFDSDSDVGGNSGSVCSDTGSNCATMVQTHGGPRNSTDIAFAAMPVAICDHSTAVPPLPTSANGTGGYSSPPARSSHSQLSRVELTTFEICMLPECGR